jgi:hypothetical protein
LSGFTAEWLSLREPYDLAARNAAVLAAVAGSFGSLGAVSVVDLACGTGATLRALSRHLPPQQQWRLVDNDLGLLGKAAMLGRPPRVAVVGQPVDLARDLELALASPLDLVAMSALLDLVSPEWLDRLVIETAARRLPVYAALTYDGRVTIEPADPFDAQILSAFDLDQRTDKGFGPALGPAASARAIERFEHFGFAVEHGRSDWVLGPSDLAIQDALLGGLADVATTKSADVAAESAHWLARRRSDLALGRCRLRIGHVDFFARPIGTR